MLVGRIPLKSMANFSKQAAVSIRAGLTLSRAFPVIEREAKDRRLKSALREIGSDIALGNTLSEALRAHEKRFPPIFVEMVQAGESSGHLETVFSRLAEYFDTRLTLRRATIRASVYPAFQLGMALAVLALITIVFSADKVATAQSLVYGAGSAIVAIGVSVWFLSRTTPGRRIWDRVTVSVPLMRSVTVKLSMARFTRTLAMQIESAVPLMQAVERSAAVTGNSVVARSLKEAASAMGRGVTMAEALSKSRFVTPMVREVLVVGEETGSFSESLERVADIYEDEAMMVLESIPKMIGPVVVVIVGAVVVYLFYTVYYVHYLKPLLEMVGY
ncbi:MAG: type II secretion system F family protein [Candidatus Abyssubacteria bacterium]